MQLFTQPLGTQGATLTAYLQDAHPDMPLGATRPALVLCPGGGYASVSARESDALVFCFLNMGFHVFKVCYTVQGADSVQQSGKVPQNPLGMQPLCELALAMKEIRTRHSDWRVIPNQIAVCGCSAGAHLAGSLGVLYADAALCALADATPAQLRPDAMILSYPVITEGEFAHRNSFLNLVGADAPQALREQYSLERKVTPTTPPTFLWHTVEDELVPVENSLLMAAALQRNKVPFELHLFDHGVHGLSTCNAVVREENPHAAHWMQLCQEWLKRQFALPW